MIWCVFNACLVEVWNTGGLLSLISFSKITFISWDKLCTTFIIIFASHCILGYVEVTKIGDGLVVGQFSILHHSFIASSLCTCVGFGCKIWGRVAHTWIWKSGILGTSYFALYVLSTGSLQKNPPYFGVWCACEKSSLHILKASVQVLAMHIMWFCSWVAWVMLDYAKLEGLFCPHWSIIGDHYYGVWCVLNS